MKRILVILLLLSPLLATAQVDTGKWLPALPAYFSFLKYEDNVINRPNKLDGFFNKLQTVRNTHKGRVTIIHIGDSHLQADGITSVLRNGFQDYFGDAGRGLVFPYQLAGTNAPHDVTSSSNSPWKSNKITTPSSPSQIGISGYGIHSAKKDATVNLKLKDIDGKQEHFNQMVFFLCNDSVCYKLTDSSLNTPLAFSTHAQAEGLPVIITSDSFLTGFGLTATSAPAIEDHLSFYGVSLEKKDSSGVLYHTIGVNGARMDQFLQNDLFWKQLKNLNGDLYIVSLGTNEAQNPFINQPALMAICDSIVQKIHKVAPGAQVLFTTPAGSYYKMKKPNVSLENVTEAYKKYCDSKSLPYWDLYHVGSGKTGIPAWKKYDLLSHDLVHYNNAGYQLQGQLLLNAFAKAYNNYDRSHPYHPTAQPKVAEPRPKAIKKDSVKTTLPKTVTVQQPEMKQGTKPVTPQAQPNPHSKIVVEYYDN